MQENEQIISREENVSERIAAELMHRQLQNVL